MQAVKVATDLAVKAKKDPEFSQHRDSFESTYQKFNEFAITVSVGIAQVEEAGGDFHTRNGRNDSYVHEYSICLLKVCVEGHSRAPLEELEYVWGHGSM